jgi:hypothetical protein
MKTLLAAVEDRAAAQAASVWQRRGAGRAGNGAGRHGGGSGSDVMDAAPGDDDWKRYLSGDRAVFARKLAAAIDDAAIDRITTFYREDARFHDAADAYLSEFESLLAQGARRRWRRPAGLGINRCSRARYRQSHK